MQLAVVPGSVPTLLASLTKTKNFLKSCRWRALVLEIWCLVFQMLHPSPESSPTYDEDFFSVHYIDVLLSPSYCESNFSHMQMLQSLGKVVTLFWVLGYSLVGGMFVHSHKALHLKPLFLSNRLPYSVCIWLVIK